MSPADVVRLESADLDELDKVVARPSSIKRIRDHHHLVARMVARGMRTGDVAREVGFSISRISILKSDPAFRQLVEMYRLNYNQLEDIAFMDAKKKASLLLCNGLDLLNDRYEEDPDSITGAEARSDIETAQSVMDDKVTKVATLHGHLSDLGIAEQFELQSKRADRLIAPAHLPGSSGPEPPMTPAPGGDE